MGGRGRDAGEGVLTRFWGFPLAAEGNAEGIVAALGRSPRMLGEKTSNAAETSPPHQCPSFADSEVSPARPHPAAPLIPGTERDVCVPPPAHNHVHVCFFVALAQGRSASATPGRLFAPEERKVGGEEMQEGVRVRKGGASPLS